MVVEDMCVCDVDAVPIAVVSWKVDATGDAVAGEEIPAVVVSGVVDPTEEVGAGVDDEKSTVVVSTSSMVVEDMRACDVDEVLIAVVSWKVGPDVDTDAVMMAVDDENSTVVVSTSA